MTQDHFADAADAPERVRTGADRVDAVIASIEALADRSVDEHVAVFEQAHDELRRALDGTPHDDPA